MPENNRSIGSAGLEQGGPNLGNDITRDDLSLRNAGDALTTPKSMNAEPGNKNNNDTDLPENNAPDIDDDDDLLLDDELDDVDIEEEENT